MKYRQWFLLALSPLLLVVALVGVRSFDGSGVAEAQAPQLAIDMVQDTGWCNTIDSTASHTNIEGPYKVAICLTGAAGSPAASDFNIILTYDSQLNTCSSTGQTYPALDANPDFISTVGTGWDCSSGSQNFPKCGETAGRASITCGTTNDPGNLAGNWAIALVTFSVAAGGTDNLAFGTTALYDYAGENIIRCPSANCVGATDEKTGGAIPTPTSTPPPPTATSTPWCGGVEQTPCPTSTPTSRAWTKTPTPTLTGTPAPSEPGEPAPPPPPPPTGAQLPEVVPPATGTGGGGGAWTASLIWTLAGAGAFSILLGGLHLRRARNR